MNSESLLPYNSMISAKQGRKRLCYSWPVSEIPLAGRLFPMAFLLFWITFWTLGGLLAIASLIRDIIDKDFGFPLFFLMVWIIGWAFGWIAAAKQLKRLFSGKDYEQILLSEDALGHRITATSVRPVTVRRQDIKEILLDSDGSRQRLRVLSAAGDLEIGSALSNKDRQWLMDRLEEWMNS